MAGPFDLFLEFLDAGTIKNLRLTCWAVSDRCLTPRFKKSFREIRTTLDPVRLRSLITLLENPFLGQKCIQRLTIQATLYDFAPLHMAMATRRWSGDSPAGSPDSSPDGSPDGQMRPLSDKPLNDKDKAKDDKGAAVLESGLSWLHTKKLREAEDHSQPVVALLSQILRLLTPLEKLSLEYFCIDGPSELVPKGPEDVEQSTGTSAHLQM
jgi:hypothetical protein